MCFDHSIESGNGSVVSQDSQCHGDLILSMIWYPGVPFGVPNHLSRHDTSLAVKLELSVTSQGHGAQLVYRTIAKFSVRPLFANLLTQRS